MNDENSGLPPLSRRRLLKGMGVALAATPLLQFVGCNIPTDDTGDDSSGGASGWVVGGTAAMIDAANYPNPFANDTGTECALTCAMTLGPCFAESVVRQDISEGYPGLPVRLALRLVQADGCTPVAGAEVDIWHCSVLGLYSGDDASDFCTSGDSDARSHRFFRGTQTSDADGQVRFDTCFPGWYSSRAIHIHFQVRLDGNEYVVSQLFFPEDITADIFSTLAGYVDRGQPDTTHTTDTVLGGTDASPYIVNVARMSDGAMLASKTIVLRSSLDDSLCNVGGTGGPPPPGGFPDGGMPPPPP